MVGDSGPLGGSVRTRALGAASPSLPLPDFGSGAFTATSNAPLFAVTAGDVMVGGVAPPGLGGAVAGKPFVAGSAPDSPALMVGLTGVAPSVSERFLGKESSGAASAGWLARAAAAQAHRSAARRLARVSRPS